jgi:hypothetical protein
MTAPTPVVISTDKHTLIYTDELFSALANAVPCTCNAGLGIYVPWTDEAADWQIVALHLTTCPERRAS